MATWHDASIVNPQPSAGGRAIEPRSGARVLVFDAGCGLGPECVALLEGQGLDVILCVESRILVEQVIQHPPGVVISGLRPDSAEDLGVLQLVRRASPDVPIILLAVDGSLETQRLVQSLRPIYYAVCPIEPGELNLAVISALARPRHGAAAHRAGRADRLPPAAPVK